MDTKYPIKIAVSNTTKGYSNMIIVIIIFSIQLIPAAYFGALFEYSISALCICLILCGIINRMSIPRDISDEYLIYPDRILWKPATIKGNKEIIIYLQNIYNLEYINRRYNKMIRMLHIKYGRQMQTTFSPHTLEDCWDVWKQLFEEIRTRVPKKTKVITK